jgi:hypothetical protein
MFIDCTLRFDCFILMFGGSYPHCKCLNSPRNLENYEVNIISILETMFHPCGEPCKQPQRLPAHRVVLVAAGLLKPGAGNEGSTQELPGQNQK